MLGPGGPEEGEAFPGSGWRPSRTSSVVQPSQACPGPHTPPGPMSQAHLLSLPEMGQGHPFRNSLGSSLCDPRGLGCVSRLARALGLKGASVNGRGTAGGQPRRRAVLNAAVSTTAWNRGKPLPCRPQGAAHHRHSGLNPMAGTEEGTVEYGHHWVCGQG